MNEQINLIADWVLLVSFPPIFLFVLFYLRSRWRTYEVGRALMHLAVSLCIVVGVVLLSLFFGSDYPGRPVVRLIGYLILCAATWRMLYVLIKTQQEKKDPPHPLRRADDPLPQATPGRISKKKGWRRRVR